MAKYRYILSCWDDQYEVVADLSQSCAPIIVDGRPTPFQTADVRHDIDEMRVVIARWLYRGTPDHGADFDEEAELELLVF